MGDIALAERYLNAGILISMAASGFAYGWLFLWELNIRDAVRLWAAAVMPGVVFLLMVWGVRAAQGVATGVYLFLVLDWLIFANVACLTVFARRRTNRRKEG